VSNPVRVVDVFVEELDLASMDYSSGAGEDRIQSETPLSWSAPLGNRQGALCRKETVRYRRLIVLLDWPMHISLSLFMVQVRSLRPATLLVLLCGLSVSVLLYSLLRASEHERIEFDFERRVQTRLAVVTRSFDNAADAMRATNFLFSSTPTSTVSDAQYAGFTAPLLAVHPYIESFLFFRFVGDADRAAYEARRRTRLPGFEIRERAGDDFIRAPQRPVYLTLELVAPIPPVMVEHGYDIWAYAPHRALAERTLTNVAYTSSGLIARPGPRQRQVVVLALGLQATGAGLPVLGVTEAVVDAAALIRQNLLQSNLLRGPGIELTVSGQVSDGLGLRELARYGAVDLAGPYWLRVLTGTSADPIERSRRFVVGGRDWEMRARTVEPATVHLGSSAMLFFCVMFTLALTGYVRGRQSWTRRVEALVEVRTADLKRASEESHLYFRAIESSANAVLLVDATRAGYPIQYVNPAFEQTRGIRSADILGHGLIGLLAGMPGQAGEHELRKALNEGRSGHAVLRMRRGDGSQIICEVHLAPVRDAAGRIEHFVLNEYDVTAAITDEAQLEYQARYDSLTELPNRVLLTDRIERATSSAIRHGLSTWVVVLDLDHFKYVNDSLGHSAGDRLLRKVSERICGGVQAGDTVARTGGDEFVLLLVDRDEDQVALTVNNVLLALDSSFEECGRRIHLSCSAGIAGYPADGGDADTLIRHAEIAMYRAKEAGRHTLRFYLASMNERATERLALVYAMREALEANQFELHYQPQIALADGAVIGMEALIRWSHPELGMIRPDRFIGLAEDTGLIVPIGTWALRTACRQTALWQQAGHAPLRIAVNLSARQFHDTGLVKMVAQALAESKLPASCLELELTESLMMENVERAMETMHELKAMGVKLAIDDFGTGYSSLAYLKRFPMDVLKIDQSFVRDIENDASSAAMVGAIISLAHELGVRVIAEGVETAAQLAFLHYRNCDEAQGYLYSRPLAGADFLRMLERVSEGVKLGSS
jgi:diguanylate cyclase (GGDEF)-like protein/PAS domain S-box-containing protein